MISLHVFADLFNLAQSSIVIEFIQGGFAVCLD